MRLPHAGICFASFAAAASLALSACLRPPLTNSAATAAPSQPASVHGGRLADGNRLVLWDGNRIPPRNVGTGRSARLDFWDGGKSWADCDSKPSCKAALGAKSGAGLGGGKGLQFHAEGAGWAGSGWSWFGWYPPTAGTDLSPYGTLTFQIRVEAKLPDAAPDPRTVEVLLVCSNGKKTTARAVVQKYEALFDDGGWHKVAIPVADLTSGDGAGFDSKTVWEFRLSTWNATPRSFNIYIDQIAAEK
ncbi:MAG TPA: hypothetical protein VN894_00630 [Polyangiaceae bacterium]|nr:hypothetical protein [Polyangiaceae bacterium]